VADWVWTRRRPHRPDTTSSTWPTTRCPTWTSDVADAGPVRGEHTKAWAATIAPYDGYVFVTPEYNHSTSGVLRTRSTTSTPSGPTGRAFVSTICGGARAVEHLRLICSELQIAHVRQQLSFSMFTDFENSPRSVRRGDHDDAAAVMFDHRSLGRRAPSPSGKP